MRSAMWRAGSPAGAPIRERVRAGILRARRADRRLHLHRPSGPRARGAPAAGIERDRADVAAAGIVTNCDKLLKLLATRCITTAWRFAHSTTNRSTSASARPSRTRSSRGNIATAIPLPSVRALAAEEQANPLTVAKAYQGFQDEGLIVVKRGVGMFVAPGARARLSESERNRFLKEEWPEIRARMRRLGIERVRAAGARERLALGVTLTCFRVHFREGHHLPHNGC